MHEIYELKEMLMKELEEYGSKGEMSTGSLDIVDKLAHTIKNLCKIIEAAEEEGGYSERGGSYAEGGRGGNRGGNRGGGSSSRSRSYRGGSYADGGQGGNQGGGGSYARGRGRSARRDSMGRYSREDGYSRNDELEDMVESIREMMQELPQEVQRDAQRFVQKLEQEMM